MMFRDGPGGPIVVGQPAHAWVCGQMARAWGNARFGGFEPRDEVGLAADQHDAGMAAWDSAPDLNPATGRPYSFLEMPLATHLRLWRGAKAQVLPQNRYAALLVSLHGSGLYERRDTAPLPPADRTAVVAFLEAEHAYQARLFDGLRGDPRYAPHAEPATVARNRALVRTWDNLSLALCMGAAARTVADVPAGAGTATLALTALDTGRLTYRLDPWPFRDDTVTFAVDGRRLPDTFANAEAMRAALDGAEWVTLIFRLVRADGTDGEPAS